MDGKRLNIAMLLYPGVTAQDFIGPHTILSLFADIRLCWKNTDPIATDSGIRIIPDSTFADCAGEYDMLPPPWLILSPKVAISQPASGLTMNS